MTQPIPWIIEDAKVLQQLKQIEFDKCVTVVELVQLLQIQDTCSSHTNAIRYFMEKVVLNTRLVPGIVRQFSNLWVYLIRLEDDIDRRFFAHKV